MSKFEVGDRVRTVLPDSMYGTITKTTGKAYCNVQFDINGCTYSMFTGDIELVDPDRLTKKDLRTGMGVKFRDGTLGKICLNTFYGDIVVYHGAEEHDLLDNWDTNFNAVGNVEDIMVVYHTFCTKDLIDFAMPERKVAWMRFEDDENSAEEYTLGELAKILGHKIKIVEG